MKDLELKDNPTLADFQDYVVKLELQRGFSDQTAIEKCLLLGEEMGELFKAVRKAMNLKMDINASTGSIKDEIADMMIYLCAIANRFDIDIEQAFREKEEVNKRREWI
jgi:NTP pyrophosphatase (non-canonical NTP hydrolase)